MNVIFGNVRKELYKEYETEISALVESLDPTPYLYEKEVEEQQKQQVPDHLRFAFTKQQLLCLRAAKVSPPILERIRKEEEEKRRTKVREEEEKVVHSSDSRAYAEWKRKEAEMMEKEAALVNQLREYQQSLSEKVYGSGSEAKKLQMHRIQSEAVRKLRESILAQQAYAEAKRHDNVPHHSSSLENEQKTPPIAGGASSQEEDNETDRLLADGGNEISTSVSPQTTVFLHPAPASPFVDSLLPQTGNTGEEEQKFSAEDMEEKDEESGGASGVDRTICNRDGTDKFGAVEEEGPTAAAVTFDWVTHLDNIQAVKEGGRYGEAYAKQRLDILNVIDHRLREETLVRRVNALL